MITGSSHINRPMDSRKSRATSKELLGNQRAEAPSPPIYGQVLNKSKKIAHPQSAELPFNPPITGFGFGGPGMTVI